MWTLIYSIPQDSIPMSEVNEGTPTGSLSVLLPIFEKNFYNDVTFRLRESYIGYKAIREDLLLSLKEDNK